MIRPPEQLPLSPNLKQILSSSKTVARQTTVIITKRNSEMELKRNGSQPSGKGPADYFTGAVRIDPLFQAPDPARVLAVSVTFEPGARTAWHRHPLGQTLIVTSGCGWVQSEGGPKKEIRPGDVVGVRRVRSIGTVPHQPRQ